MVSRARGEKESGVVMEVRSSTVCFCITRSVHIAAANSQGWLHDSLILLKASPRYWQSKSRKLPARNKSIQGFA